MSILLPRMRPRSAASLAVEVVGHRRIPLFAVECGTELRSVGSGAVVPQTFTPDGHEDALARSATTGILYLYPGTGTGFGTRTSFGTWKSMREITPVGDLTGDGYPDLLAVQTSTGALYLYPGHGTTLGARKLIGTSGWNAMSELTGIGDFNHDGHVDLLARHTATGVLWLYPGRTGGLGTRTSFGTWKSMRDLVGIGDFDRDGFTDLFAVQSATGKLLMYPGRGTALASALQVGSNWTTGLRPLL